MGMDVEVRLRLVVRDNDSVGYDDSEERLLKMMLKLISEGVTKLEPVTIERDEKVGQLLCTACSYLRTKTGSERYLDRTTFKGSYLPGLCKKYAVTAEVWTRCGEAGYDEHIVIDYDGEIVVKETFPTTPFGVLCDKPPDWEPSLDEMRWNAKWGKWTIPAQSEYAEKELLKDHALKTIEEKDIPF